jgi:outer membrane immunogenic protein
MHNRKIAVACLALGMLTPLKAHADPTLAQVVARLDAVEKENAALRARVRRLESRRSEIVVATPISGTRTHAAAPRQSAVGPAVYDAVGPGVYKAPAIVAVPSNWTGPYVGASLGFGSQWSKQPIGLAASGFGIPDAVESAASSVAIASVPASVITDPNGYIAGGEVGYNYQIDRFVIGAEADLSASGISGRASQMGAFAASPPAAVFGFISATTLVNAEQHLDWLGTVRARVGYVPTSNLLLYATGGLAYGQVDSTTAISQGVCTSAGGGMLCNTATGTGSASAVRPGWAVGGGFEYALAENWSVKAEYLHYDLGSLSYGVGALSMAVQPSPPEPANSITTNVGATARFNGDIGRVGLNYRFQ